MGEFEIEGKASSRSLKLFFLVDCSYSMTNDERIQRVNHGIRNVLPSLEAIGDDNRLDISIGIIAFGDNAEWRLGPDLPLSDAISNYKDLNADKGMTATSKAFALLAQELSMERMGMRAVPPVAILLSDGYSTDKETDYEDGIHALNALPWGKKCVRLSIGIGSRGSADYNKEELDSFISKYLRDEGGVETLEADDVRKIALYIKTASEVASNAAAKSDPNAGETNSPVRITKEDLDVGDEITIDDASEIM